MTYQTTVISGSATPALDALNWLKSNIDAHPAWEYAGQYGSGVAAPGGYLVDWFRCLGSANGTGKDFYVCFARVRSNPDATSTIYVGTTEEMVLSTLGDYAMKKPVVWPGWSGTPALPDYTISDTATYWPTSSQVANYSLSTSSGTMIWRLIVTSKGLWLHGLTGSADITEPIYCGLFESLITHPAEFPLMMSRLGANADEGAVSRKPGDTSTNVSRQWAIGGGLSSGHRVTSPVATIPNPGAIYNNRAIGAKIAIYHYNTGSVGVGHRGIWPGLLYFNESPALSDGDTMLDDNGDLWVRLSGAMWMKTSD